MYILNQDRDKILKMIFILKLKNTLYIYDETKNIYKIGIYSNKEIKRILKEIEQEIKNNKHIYIMPE